MIFRATIDSILFSGKYGDGFFMLTELLYIITVSYKTSYGDDLDVPLRS